MVISYNKLWKLLIDRGLKKTELVKLSGITSNAMAKMGRNESVQVNILGKVCATLGCNVDEIMEFVLDEEKEDK
ncbi:MAG: helix-turn-helix transcriptional regulator [Butyrivibrio sp.]|nr:helix-turn-helix transcriptional regulator [Butyrivibrio sp.]